MYTIFIQNLNGATNRTETKRGEDSLNRYGRRIAQRVGNWMLEADCTPELVMIAPTGASRDAVLYTLNAMNRPAKGGVIEDRHVALGKKKAMMDLLHQVDRSVRQLLIIGDGATVGAWSRFLSDRRSSPDGILTHFSMVDHFRDLKPGKARRLGSVTLDRLPRGFVYPGPNGDERRPRPAYYYSQAAVIPYRHGKKGLEILMIRSSKGRHWLVPKGIQEPGLTARQTAIQEAREEAGAIGELDEQSLGDVRYRKWGAQCRCRVFSMEVKRLLEPGKWPEHRRGRIWMTPEDAADRIRHKELGDMIRLLAAGTGKKAKGKKG